MKTRNHRMYEAIVPVFGSVAEFCRRSGMAQDVVGRFINLKQSPFMVAERRDPRDAYGETQVYTVTARRLAETCGYSCADLFPLELYARVAGDSTARRISVYRALVGGKRKAALTVDASRDHESRLADVEVVALALRELPLRYAEVVRRRFGFTDGTPMTLDEVATGLHLSRERIRQIEQRTIRRLRHPERVDLLLGREPRDVSCRSLETSSQGSRERKRTT